MNLMDRSDPGRSITSRTAPLRRRVLPLLAAGGVALTSVALGTLRPAPVSAQSAGVATDYAAEAFGDPWDWSNPEDGGPATDLLSSGITSSSISTGELHFNVSGPSFWYFLQGGYADSTPTGKDANLHPVDAARYDRIVMKITSSQNISAGLLWFACNNSDSCGGGVPIDIRGGTNVYDIPLGPARLLTHPWNGQISSMRLDFAPNVSTELSFDWIRLTSMQAGQVDEWRGPVPDVVDPDAAGGDDFATLTRNGDAWDFDKSTDYLRADNATVSVADGRLNGTNAAPALNDPSVTFKVPVAFKGDDFHRMTVRWSFDGPFSLKDSAGGGMNARIVWRIAGTPPTPDGKDLQESRDIVMYPWENEVSVDLATNPASAVVDPRPGKAKIGWAGQSIELVRFDPNEDPGPRAWHIDDVRLAADDAGETSFDIKLRDNKPGAGTTADVFTDSDQAGFDGSAIAQGVDLSSGTATVHWEPPAGTNGKFWIYTVVKRGNAVVKRYSTGPVVMGRKSGVGAYQFGPAVGGPASQIGIADAPPAGATPTTIAPVPTTVAPVTTAPTSLALKPKTKVLKNSLVPTTKKAKPTTTKKR
jgi:hypothetical protein